MRRIPKEQQPALYRKLCSDIENGTPVSDADRHKLPAVMQDRLNRLAVRVSVAKQEDDARAAVGLPPFLRPKRVQYARVKA